MYYNVIQEIIMVTRTIISLSVSKAEDQMINKIMKEEGKTRSEIVREAIKQYQFKRTLVVMQKTGVKIAAKMGIETYDDIERIAG